MNIRQKLEAHTINPKNVILYISYERFGRYLKATGGDEHRALLLYEYNTLLSESLYGALKGLEIALRNAIHFHISTSMNTPYWFETANLLLEREREDVRTARQKLEDTARAAVNTRNPKPEPVSAGKLVAALSFGFWVGIISRDYRPRIWSPTSLWRAFPGRPAKFSSDELWSRLNELRLLRNRIAHHEPIFNRNIGLDFGIILETASWINYDTAAWLLKTSTLDETSRKVGWGTSNWPAARKTKS